VDAFQRSSALLVELGDDRGQAMVLNSLGGVLQRQGRFDEAVDAFQRSSAIEEQLGNLRGLAMVLNSLGGVLQRQGRFDEAVDAFQRSYALLVELGDDRGQAMVHTALGKALLSHGDIKESVVELLMGFEIDEGLNNRRGIGIVTPVLIEALLKLGCNDEAVTYCQRALAVAPRNKRLLQLCEELSSPKSVLKYGSVKCVIQSSKGYLFGFILPDDKSPDIYFREGYIDVSELVEGIRVEVKIEHGPKGPRAKSIKIVA